MKILVIRFSSIGDIVLTTPVVRALKQQLDAEVHFLCKAVFADLVRPNPYVNQVWTIQKKVAEVVPSLQKEDFDCILDLHKNWRTARLRLALRKPYYTFDKINRQKWLMVRFKINQLPPVHIVDRYWQAVAPLGISNDGHGLDYFIAPEAEMTDVRLKEKFPNFIPFEQAYFAIVVGAAHATKQIPESKIVEICKALNRPIILIGGPKEKEIGDRMVESVGNQVFNTCGQLSFGQSASLLKGARKVITPDTGMMHIAAALGKEILTVWGNTIPEFGMYPYLVGEESKYESFEIDGLSCRPCSKIGFDECPKGHFRCMKTQDSAAIAAKALKND